MSSTTIPSVAAMNEMFNTRIRSYASEFASREASSSKRTTEALKEPSSKAPKRKIDDETSETEDATEESGEKEEEEEEEEEEEAPGPQGNRKIILKINFIQNIILSVNPTPSHRPTHPPAAPEASTSRVPSAPRRRRSPMTHTSTIHQRLRPRRNGDEAQNTSTQRPLRSRQPTSTTAPAPAPTPAPASFSPSPSPPPFFPSFRIQNEKEERWDPIPLPCPLLPDDEEGPKAAWARLFPDEKPFGEYGGKPTGWMEKMCWKEGEWRARGPEEPYVERFLGKKREVEMGVRDDEELFWGSERNGSAGSDAMMDFVYY